MVGLVPVAPLSCPGGDEPDHKFLLTPQEGHLLEVLHEACLREVAELSSGDDVRQV